MIKSTNVVPIYEVDGKEPDEIPSVYMGRGPSMYVTSHHNRDAMVVLELNGRKLAVEAKDLLAAVKNATNSARW